MDVDGLIQQIKSFGELSSSTRLEAIIADIYSAQFLDAKDKLDHGTTSNVIEGEIYHTIISQYLEDHQYVRNNHLSGIDDKVVDSEIEVIIELTQNCLELELSVMENQDKEAKTKIRSLLSKLYEIIPNHVWIKWLKQVSASGGSYSTYDLFIPLQIVKLICFFEFNPPERDRQIHLLRYLSDIQRIENNQIDLIRTLRTLGKQYYFKREMVKAMQCFEEAAIIAKRLNLKKEQFGLLNNQGVVSRAIGAYDDAVKHYKKALEMTNNPKLSKFSGMVKNNLGAIYYYKNQLNIAEDYYKDALQDYKNYGTEKQIASAIDNLGEVYYAKAEYDKAIQYFNDSLTRRRTIDNLLDESTSLDNLGDVYKVKGDLEQALHWYNEAFQLRQDLKTPSLLVRSYKNLAQIYQMQGNLEKSQKYLERAIEIENKHGNIYDKLKIHFNLLQFLTETAEQDSELLIELFSRIKELYNQLDEDRRTPEVRHIFRISNLLVQKQNTRSKVNFFILKEFQDMVDEIDYNFDLQYFVYLQVIDLLIFELHTFSEREVQLELNEILMKLKNKLQIQHALPKLYKLATLDAELKLLELDLKAVESILIQTLWNTEERGLRLINSQINNFYLSFLENKNKFVYLASQGSKMKEMLQNSTIRKTIGRLISGVEGPSLDDEDIYPIMFLLLDLEKSATIFGKTFDEGFTINENLVGALISAIDSFMKEAFATKFGLNRIDYGGNTLLFTKEGNVLFCYLFTGNSEIVLPRLLKLKQEILASSFWPNELSKFSFRISNQTKTELNKLVDQYL